ncbi:MAG TPA: hypothetical protein VK105_12450 [Virgibacillus sp.]|nr:hypothetical protein [Virgibacillus sp.]HLR67916.1 hypothetical protein [Virgibacillus sp.]
MKHYDVSEAFKILAENKITTNIESVRRWLRSGTIKGIEPVSRKEGWLIREDDLQEFICSRLPDGTNPTLINATNDVKEQNKESIRSEMWWELARKYNFEGYIEPKKVQIKDCINHNRQSEELEKYVWQAISQHKMGYAKPHIPYLLDAFLFDGQRIKLDQRYELFEEKILYALIEHLRQEKVRKK